MSTTFNFEEFDETTRDYLIAVRESEGRGSPGVFANTKDALPGCGCIAGPIVIVLTLALTLTTWAGVIYHDPVGVALLQTAGLLLGGWLLAAAFRAGKGSHRIAGTWVYVDPLHLYEAFREQVTVTPIEEVVEANFTHNYNNGNYQNSVVRLSLGGNQMASVTLPNEARAEQMVVYLNYLAWARGPEGGERAKLAPATLGGLAKYVAKNDHEPLDAESNINLNLIELDIAEIPEEPAREGRALPSLLPYVFMLLFAVGCFVVMAYIVNPPVRDDAIYEAVTKEPVEPRILRSYLIDPRNTAHRDEVTKRLSQCYADAIRFVEANKKDLVLQDGMVKVLETLRTADQPVVSVRVTEKNTPAGQEGKKAARENQLRSDFALGVNGMFSQQPWGQPVKPGEGMTFPEPPPPIGEQLIAFVEAPEDADKVHFDIEYTVEPTGAPDEYRLAVTVTIRANIDDNQAFKNTFAIPGTFGAAGLDGQMTKVKDELVSRMVGKANAPGMGLAPQVIPVPNFVP